MEGSDCHPGLFERLGTCAQVGFVADPGVFVTADRDIKLSAAILPIEAVETGPVEIDDSGGAVWQCAGRGAADGIVVVGGVTGFVAQECADDGFDVVADVEIGVDEVGVDIGKDSFAGNKAEPGQLEEERASANERFIIGAERAGGLDAGDQFREEGRFPAGPFEERAGRGS